MKSFIKIAITLFVYVIILSIMGNYLLPIAEPLEIELTSWRISFIQNHPKIVVFFNFVSLVLFIIIPCLPAIIFIILSIGAFAGCVLLVDFIFSRSGYKEE